MKDEQLQPLLEGWFKDREVTPADVRHSTSRVVARVPEVRQRGRWWPLPVFDRPVSTFPSRELAPAPIPATNGPRPARGFTMLSALKYISAGVIVALFGGFLLAGVFTAPQDGEALPAAVTESPSPMTTEELLSGMITEEVEPGVLRVINDGVRDLTQQNSDVPRDAIVAGPDGSVWLGSTGRWLRLGREDPQTTMGGRPSEFEVAPDGTLWGVGAGSAHSFDGKSWTKWGSDSADLNGLTVAPDGTVWTTGGEEWGETTGLYRLTADGLTATPEWTDVHPRAAGPGHVVAAPDGAVWLIGETEADLPGYDNGGPRVDALLRFDGSEWGVVAVPDDLRYVEGQSLDIGTDGTLWAAVGNPSLEGDGLARLDDSGWTVFSEADGVRPWGIYGFIPTDHLHVAPDGSVWVNAEGDGSSCGGVANFDGTTWTGYLSDLCVYDMDIATDGAVWMQAGTSKASGGFEEWDKPDTYVIASRAVAAAEETEVTEPLPADEPTDTREASTTAEALLSGMVTEEVEPGVFRVVNDGVRDLAKNNNTDIVAGHDGGIWLLRPQRFLRLGGEWLAWAAEKPEWIRDFEVAPDGTVWTMQEDAIQSFDGEEWTTHHMRGRVGVTSDGTVWATWHDDPEGPWNPAFGYLGADGWQTVKWPDEWPDTGPSCSNNVGRCAFLVSDRGEVWALTGATDSRAVQHFVDGAWRTYDGVDDLRGSIRDAAVGADGTLWGSTRHGFFRFEGTEWTAFEWHDGFLADVFPADVFGWGEFHVAADGSLWVAPEPGECGPDRCDCDHGVTRFDGMSWGRYLPDLCVEAFDTTADGSVWLLASEEMLTTFDPEQQEWVFAGDATWDLYVITPEAVAASE